MKYLFEHLFIIFNRIRSFLYSEIDFKKRIWNSKQISTVHFKVFHFSFILRKWSLIHICLFVMFDDITNSYFHLLRNLLAWRGKRKQLQHQFNNIIHESLSKPSFETITHKVLYDDTFLHLTCFSLIWYTIASWLYITFSFFYIHSVSQNKGSLFITYSILMSQVSW